MLGVRSARSAHNYAVTLQLLCQKLLLTFLTPLVTFNYFSLFFLFLLLPSVSARSLSPTHTFFPCHSVFPILIHFCHETLSRNCAIHFFRKWQKWSRLYVYTMQVRSLGVMIVQTYSLGVACNSFMVYIVRSVMHGL